MTGRSPAAAADLPADVAGRSRPAVQYARPLDAGRGQPGDEAVAGGVGYVLGNALLDGAPRKGRAAKPKGRATWKGWSTIWRGIDAGITKFCAETGLTVEQLLVLAGGRSPLAEGARGVLHPDAPADRGCENGICRLLRQAWQGGNE